MNKKILAVIRSFKRTTTYALTLIALLITPFISLFNYLPASATSSADDIVNVSSDYSFGSTTCGFSTTDETNYTSDDIWLNTWNYTNNTQNAQYNTEQFFTLFNANKASGSGYAVTRSDYGGGASGVLGDMMLVLWAWTNPETATLTMDSSGRLEISGSALHFITVYKNAGAGCRLQSNYVDFTTYSGSIQQDISGYDPLTGEFVFVAGDIIYLPGYEGAIIPQSSAPSTPPPENAIIKAEILGKTVKVTASIDDLSGGEAYLFQISNPLANPETCQSTSDCYLEIPSSSSYITYSTVTLEANEAKGITGGTYTRSTLQYTLQYDETGEKTLFVMGWTDNGIAHKSIPINVGSTGTVYSDNEQKDTPCGIGDFACWITSGFNNLLTGIGNFFADLLTGIGNFFADLWTGFASIMEYLFVPTASDLDVAFGVISTQNHGLFAIITAPITSISTLTGVTCATVTLPLPFVNKDLTLPCMTTIYTSTFGAFFVMYQLIASGVISWFLLTNFLQKAKEFKNPKSDVIQVLDL